MVENFNDILGTIIVNTKADQRILVWLKENYSDDEIVQAIKSIKGNRKVYLTNIVKVLGTKIPPSVIKEPPTPPQEALEKLANIKKFLSTKIKH